MTERMEIQTKVDKKYVTDRTVTDKTEIYEQLAKDLLHKKIHGCTYIKSIKDRTNYDGTRTVTATYDNGVRRIYVIKD